MAFTDKVREFPRTKLYKFIERFNYLVWGAIPRAIAKWWRSRG